MSFISQLVSPFWMLRNIGKNEARMIMMIFGVSFMPNQSTKMAIKLSGGIFLKNSSIHS